jgi:hypothetical protein
MKYSMKLAFVFAVCALWAIPSFARIPVRGSSNNGVDSIAFSWDLLAPTAPVVRHGGNVMLETQIVCTNQQVAASVSGNTNNASAGTCLDGNYTFLFQFQTTATTLTATINQLQGFTQNQSLPSYGLAVCDNDPNNPDGANNTLQLCTQVSTLNINNFTVSYNKKAGNIVFKFPTIPAFPAGVGKQGQGITLVVLEHQTGQYINVPNIAFQ